MHFHLINFFSHAAARPPAPYAGASIQRLHWMSHAGEEFRRVSSCRATLCSALLANRFSICRPSHTLFSFLRASWHYSFIKQPRAALCHRLRRIRAAISCPLRKSKAVPLSWAAHNLFIRAVAALDELPEFHQYKPHVVFALSVISVRMCSLARRPSVFRSSLPAAGQVEAGSSHRNRVPAYLCSGMRGS